MTEPLGAARPRVASTESCHLMISLQIRDFLQLPHSVGFLVCFSHFYRKKNNKKNISFSQNTFNFG